MERMAEVVADSDPQSLQHFLTNSPSEDESSLVELLDYRIDFGQGYLFGAPRPARMAA